MVATPTRQSNFRRHRSIDRLTNHDVLQGTPLSNEDTGLKSSLSTERKRKNLRDLLMANDPAFLAMNRRSIISQESQHSNIYDDFSSEGDNRRFRRTNSRQRGSSSRDTSERDRRREIRRTSRERSRLLSVQNSELLPSQEQYNDQHNSIDSAATSSELTILRKLSTRHHHSTSQRKQFLKIYKQLNATNSTNAGYATIYTPHDSLPIYGMWGQLLNYIELFWFDVGWYLHCRTHRFIVLSQRALMNIHVHLQTLTNIHIRRRNASNPSDCIK